MAGTKSPDTPIKAIRDLQRRIARLERGRSNARGLAAVVYQNFTQAIPDTDEAAISFNAVETDPDSMWDSGFPLRLTIPKKGWYILTGEISFASNAIGIRLVRLEVNGSVGVARHQTNAVGGGVATHLPLARTRYMQTGDFVRLIARQTSGADLDTIGTQDTVWMSVAFLGQ